LLLEIPIPNTASFQNRIYISNQEKINCNFSGEKESWKAKAQNESERHMIEVELSQDHVRRISW
jgi:hypothetical protein